MCVSQVIIYFRMRAVMMTETSLRERVVFVSAFQDFRTKKKASIQHVAEGAMKLGYDVSFISTRYSLLSRFSRESRNFLNGTANKVQNIDGVRCFLWKTMFHPFSTRHRIINSVMSLLYEPYAALPCKEFDNIVRGADYVVVESSVAVVLLKRIRSLSPRAKIIYYATDRLDTVGAHAAVQRLLVKNAKAIDYVCVRSSKMAEHFKWASGRIYLARFGVRQEDFANVGTTPYNGRRAIVAVGSMLFDKRYFDTVPAHFSDIEFHVIGCGQTFDAPSNVVLHDEMPFRETLPYIKYSVAGVAPYLPAPGVEYLAESSLKLAQYEIFALPAICPYFAVGAIDGRYGYDVGNEASMVSATSNALKNAGSLTARNFPSWQVVADQVLHPEDYADLKLG